MIFNNLFCSGQSYPAKDAASSPSHEGGSVTVTPSVSSLASAVQIMPASVRKVRTRAPRQCYWAQSAQSMPWLHGQLMHS